MTTDFCRADAQGALLLVTITRPEVMNALPPEGSVALSAVFDDFFRAPGLRVAILTGEGDRAFCAGTDLRRHAAGGSTAQPVTGFGGLTARFDRSKPVIAAVNGAAAGGGFELALACDLIVAAEHAWFALPEVRVGLVARGGGLARLPKLLPPKVAMHMALTGRRIGAQEALRYGLVNEVVPAGDDLLAAARALAEQVLLGAPGAVRATRDIVALAAGEESIEDVCRRQDLLPSVDAWRASDERQEGSRAFVEKRPPRWSGG